MLASARLLVGGLATKILTVAADCYDSSAANLVQIGLLGLYQRGADVSTVWASCVPAPV